MFPRIVTTKRQEKTYRYLAVVESYRENGKIKQRQIGNLGNIDQYSEAEILSVINKLREFLHDNSTGTIHDITKHGDKYFGIPYVMNFFWQQFGLSEFISNALKDRNIEVDVDLCAKLLVINRLMAPSSKLSASYWAKDVYLPELEDVEPPEVHQLYRAMDYLMEIKDDLERFLYHRLTDLFSLKLTLVFYDLTSSYFEGTHCSLAKHGYSRDHRPDRLQINIGLMVTPEGLPIAHQVFEGNTPDKMTVVDSLQTLKQRFQVQECVFVGDRGMITMENLAAIQEAGYKYILGFHKRGRDMSDYLLANYQNLEEYQTVYDGDEDQLMYREVSLPETKDQGESEEGLLQLKERLQKEEASRRGRKLTAKGVMLKVAEILKAKHTERFFEVNYDGAKELIYRLNQAVIDKESLRDGKFLIKTNAGLPAVEVIQGYKNLMMVENAFREIKNLVQLRPIYHYNDRRVRAHVLICVLAYLFEQWLAVLYRRHIDGETMKAKAISDPQERDQALAKLYSQRKTGRRILRELERINATDQTFVDKRIYSIPVLDKVQTKLLNILQVPLPPKVIVRN